MRSSYRRDMQQAWNRIHAVPTQRLQTRFGTVEYAERGTGLPILNSHGVLGCHADGVDGWWTNLLGEGYRVIAPARFGYFGSTLPPNATPADQADAYALLLDHLGIDRAAVIGYSAGSASGWSLPCATPTEWLGSSWHAPAWAARHRTSCSNPSSTSCTGPSGCSGSTGGSSRQPTRG